MPRPRARPARIAYLGADLRMFSICQRLGFVARGYARRASSTVERGRPIEAMKARRTWSSSRPVRVGRPALSSPVGLGRGGAATPQAKAGGANPGVGGAGDVRKNFRTRRGRRAVRTTMPRNDSEMTADAFYAQTAPLALKGLLYGLPSGSLVPHRAHKPAPRRHQPQESALSFSPCHAQHAELATPLQRFIFGRGEASH